MTDVQRVLAALASPVRREILWRIWDGELPAGEIAAGFEVSAPTISEHLAVLRDAELVTMTAERSFRRYRARRDVLRGVRMLLLAESEKWVPADDLPEGALATSRTTPMVVAAVDVSLPRPTAFTAFIDPAIYSRWLGVPVTLVDGHFACTMEFGTNVRGTYEHVVEPSLIAISWDFEDEAVPVPGGEHRAYLRFDDRPDGGTHVEVHQLVDDEEQAGFMEVAWAMVLGRFKDGVLAANTPAAPTAPRPGRPKRSAG
ncbi:MAG TPA: metalloregulator ArsR/SmtB family transcription factor [Acidimicrobiales bacterium]|nr:metalloregulator ArsR/SmtB family transcription factor [Acidimicrobiales bacterium]